MKYTESFEKWWRAYPNKQGKQAAFKIWQRANLEKLSSLIISHTEVRAEQDVKWLGGYIPMPTTFLNQGRWEDEYERKQPKIDTTVGYTVQPDVAPPQRDAWKAKINTFLLNESKRISAQIQPDDWYGIILPARDRFAASLRKMYGEPDDINNQETMAEYLEIVVKWKKRMRSEIDKLRDHQANWLT